KVFEGLIHPETNRIGLLDLECADNRFRPNSCVQIGNFNLQGWIKCQVRLRISWLDRLFLNRFSKLPAVLRNQSRGIYVLCILLH
ncbi:uncharacterized protein PgNI_00172, partial [Pyricularia grisea]|uniref:Uncharacterized protein n=1 Tax=Pyricularia grisea TaxID=148305 RepID=A0A6P8BFM9_PYRGI